MLGTDYPFPLGELQPGKLIESMEEFDDTLKVLTKGFSVLPPHSIILVLDISFILLFLNVQSHNKY